MWNPTSNKLPASCHSIHYDSLYLTCEPVAHPSCNLVFSCVLDILTMVPLVCFFITIPYAGAGSQLAPPLTPAHLFVRKGADVFHHCWGSCQPLTCPHSARHPLPSLLWFSAAWFFLWGLPPNSSMTHDGWSNFHSLWSKISKLSFTGSRDCNLRG